MICNENSKHLTGSFVFAYVLWIFFSKSMGGCSGPAHLSFVFFPLHLVWSLTGRPEERAGQRPEEYLVEPSMAEHSVFSARTNEKLVCKHSYLVVRDCPVQKGPRHIIRSVSCDWSACCSGSTCSVRERLAAVLSSGCLAPFVNTKLNFQVHHCQEVTRLEEIYEAQEEAAWKEH